MRRTRIIKRALCIVLTLVCVLCISIPAKVFADEYTIPLVADADLATAGDNARKPVSLRKTGVASLQVNNSFIEGTLYANYDVRYSVSGGMFTVSSCVAEYDYFTGYVRGDIYQPYVEWSASATGTLTITFYFQTKYEIKGVNYYSDRFHGSTVINLAN